MRKKRIYFVALIIVIILVDIGIYFFYYAPRARVTAFFYGGIEQIDVPAFIIELSLSDEAKGKLITIDYESDVVFQVKPGKKATISTRIPESLSSILPDNPKYLVREFSPIKMPVIFTKPENVNPPRKLFTYKEPPFMADVFTLLASKEHTFIEVVPFWSLSGTGKNKILWHVNRMLAFPDSSRQLTNKTISIDYSHLIGEKFLEGPDVKKLEVNSLNNDVILFVKEHYEQIDPLQLSVSNETFVIIRENKYKYFIS